MSNSPFQFPGIPPMMSDLPSAMQGGLEFWQKLMGLTQQLPTGLKSLTPTLNLDELDQRLTDLRAVEAWLQLNLSMLQSSIQALEVQRSTIATLKSFGAPFDAPFGASAGASAQATSQSSSPTSSTSKPAATNGWAASVTAEKVPPTSDVDKKNATPQKSTASDKTELPGAPTPDANPSTASDPALLKAGEQWWKMVQAQFDQLAKSAGVSAGSAMQPASTGVTPPRAATGRTRPPATTPTAARPADTPSSSEAADARSELAPLKRAAAKRSPTKTRTKGTRSTGSGENPRSAGRSKGKP